MTEIHESVRLLDDLISRLERAENTVDHLIEEGYGRASGEQARLDGKAEGIALALSYALEMRSDLYRGTAPDQGPDGNGTAGLGGSVLTASQEPSRCTCPTYPVPDEMWVEKGEVPPPVEGRVQIIEWDAACPRHGEGTDYWRETQEYANTLADRLGLTHNDGDRA